MNNKKLIAFLGALSLGALSTRAQTATSAPAVSASPPDVAVTFTPEFVSQYMFRGQRLGGPSFESSLEADYDGWALGVWDNWPVADAVPGQSDPEIDPYGSYTYKVTDAFNLQPGFTAYTYANAPTERGFYRATFEPNFAANYTIDGLKITPKFYYDVILRSLTSELSAGYALPVRELATELDFTGTIGNYFEHDAVNDVSPGVKSVGNYWLLGVSAPFQITRAAKLVLGWDYTEGTGAYLKQGTEPRYDNPLAVGRGVFSASLAYTF